MTTGNPISLVSIRAVHCRGALSKMRVSTKGILITALLAMTMTTASAAQECITTLPAKRDVHWYYYVRKSDGAHCWYPGPQRAHVVSQDVSSREPKRQSQSKLTKPAVA